MSGSRLRRYFTRPAASLAALLTAGLILCLPGRGELPPSVWDGIYTEGQAARGESAYRQYCASCHGSKLDGGDEAPSLAGSDFLYDWDLMTVADIAEEMQFTMPPNRPLRLGEQTNALILAYILKVNKFPAGKQELPEDADPLRAIIFTARRLSE